MKTEYGELLFVQYDKEGHPFGVVTLEEGHLGKTEWDFEWSKAFSHSYYDNSGGGGELAVVLGQFCQPKPPYRFWAAPQIVLLRSVKRGKGWGYAPCLAKHWGPMGNLRIEAPLGDPFEDAVEGEAIYCRTCKDWLPDEPWGYCQHLAWCERCEEVVHVLPSGHKGWDEYRHGGRRKRHNLEAP